MTAKLEETTEEIFNRLKKQWKEETCLESSPVNRSIHPTYQQIIGLGKEAIPLILRELENELDWWFWALRAITREDPVPAGSASGRLDTIKNYWLEWGRKNHYI